MKNKPLLNAFLAVILICGFFLASAMRFGAVQAVSVDSIAKPSPPEFTVKIVSYPYDVPPKTTTIIDQYTGKETTITQPGYHVENKLIEITIKNPSFTPIAINEFTYWNSEQNRTDIFDCNYTAELYYGVRVKGRFGNDWQNPYSISSYENTAKAQLDSEYTVLTIGADYSDGAQLDLQVRAGIGYYLPEYRFLYMLGYKFYGRISEWGNTQSLTMGEVGSTAMPDKNQPTPTSAPAQMPTSPNMGSTSPPGQEAALTQEQLEPIIGVAIIVAVIGAGLGLLVYLIKRK